MNRPISRRSSAQPVVVLGVGMCPARRNKQTADIATMMGMSKQHRRLIKIQLAMKVAVLLTHFRQAIYITSWVNFLAVEIIYLTHPTLTCAYCCDKLLLPITSIASRYLCDVGVHLTKNRPCRVTEVNEGQRAHLIRAHQRVLATRRSSKTLVNRFWWNGMATLIL